MIVVLLSYEQHYPNEASLLNEMFEQGLTHFHLRKPGWTLTETSTLLKQIDSTYHNRIVLHDHYELQASFQLKGAHFNSRSDDNWNGFVAYASSTSASFHSFEEVHQEGYEFDYVFLSPIFDSISKKGYKSAFDKQQLTAFLQQDYNTKVVALGGINISNLDACREMGFDGVALMGAIWNNDQPVEALKKMTSHVKEAC